MRQPMNHERSSHRTDGFSLVELLVVIAIVGLLVALMMPSLKRARDVAKRMQCSNAIRQVGIATATYATDNKQIIPTGFQATAATDPLYNYLTQNLPVKGCPYKGKGAHEALSNSVSFTINDYYRFDATTWNCWGPLRLDKLNKPSTSILGLDCYITQTYSPIYWETYTLAEGRHDGEGLTFVFPDGHTEHLKGGTPDVSLNYYGAEWRTRFPSHSIPQTVTTGPCVLYRGCFWHPI